MFRGISSLNSKKDSMHLRSSEGRHFGFPGKAGSQRLTVHQGEVGLLQAAAGSGSWAWASAEEEPCPCCPREFSEQSLLTWFVAGYVNVLSKARCPAKSKMRPPLHSFLAFDSMMLMNSDFFKWKGLCHHDFSIKFQHSSLFPEALGILFNMLGMTYSPGSAFYFTASLRVSEHVVRMYI